MNLIAHALNNTYQIVINDKAHLSLDNYISSKNKLVVIIDDKVDESLFSSLLSKALVFKITASEKTKNLETVQNIFEFLFKNNITRNDTLISIGGGVTSDITGLAASLYKRGINWINIPTTLLAMVDASIGGKVGVNFSSFKNGVGVIKFPNIVIIDITTLQTLSKREFNNGLCEVLKMGLTLDKTILPLLDDQNNLELLIQKCIIAKDNIIQKDVYDFYARHILNFGHTFGHALEMLSLNSNYPYLHGESILLGMQFVSELKMQKIIASYIAKWNIPYDFKFDKEEIKKIIINDKKNIDNKVCIVYLNDYENYEIKYISATDINSYITKGCGFHELK